MPTDFHVLGISTVAVVLGITLCLVSLRRLARVFIDVSILLLTGGAVFGCFFVYKTYRDSTLTHLEQSLTQELQRLLQDWLETLSQAYLTIRPIKS